MPDPFTNARPYLDPVFPSSGDSFSIQNFKRQFQALGFMDMLPLQPRAHNPANTSIMVRGRDASSFYNPVYYGDADQRIFFSSGDSGAFSAPVSNPRLDIVYLTPSGDIKISQGTEAATPVLPSLSPSGDTRMPVCAVYNRTTQTKIVNFEDKDSNTGDGYIYQDLRPWLRIPSLPGSSNLTNLTPISATGDNAIGTATTAARGDHSHQGVHGVRVVGQALQFGDVEFAGGGGVLTQTSGRITVNSKIVQIVNFQTGALASGATAMPNDDTIPQSGEGNEFMTLAITPTNTNNKLKIDVVWNGNNGTTTQVIVALFQDSTANALAAVSSDGQGTGTVTGAIVFSHFMTAGTTSATTFKVRAGGSSGTTYFNGDASTAARKYGGVMASSITITEIAV